MPEPSSPWTLECFPESVAAWIERESPTDEAQLVVLDWILSRHVHPYRGMRREVSYDNLWFGLIPGTQTARGVVACSYWIIESDRMVRCNDITTLSYPI